jgi:hypothetical protein
MEKQKLKDVLFTTVKTKTGAEPGVSSEYKTFSQVIFNEEKSTLKSLFFHKKHDVNKEVIINIHSLKPHDDDNDNFYAFSRCSINGNIIKDGVVVCNFNRTCDGLLSVVESILTVVNDNLKQKKKQEEKMMLANILHGFTYNLTNMGMRVENPISIDNNVVTCSFQLPVKGVANKKVIEGVTVKTKRSVLAHVKCFVSNKNEQVEIVIFYTFFDLFGSFSDELTTGANDVRCTFSLNDHTFNKETISVFIKEKLKEFIEKTIKRREKELNKMTIQNNIMNEVKDKLFPASLEVSSPDSTVVKTGEQR